MAKKIERVAVEAKGLQIIEYRGQRVATTEQLALGYGAEIKNIQNNFNRNQSRFVEGKYFFRVEGHELSNLRSSISGEQISNRTGSLILWTERGAANHAKMLETDRAWDYYSDLIEFYFARLDAKALPAPVELSKLGIIQVALESEKGCLAEKEQADHAVRIKSQISQKHEASVLVKLSAATRNYRVLEELLGESVKHAINTKVGSEYKFVKLRHGVEAVEAVEAVEVPDLRKLFGGEA